MGCKGYIIEQSLLDWQFVYICRNCQAATGTLRSISQNERKTAKNESDERRRDMSEGQNQFNRQDSVSFPYPEHANFQLQLPGANKGICSDMQNVFSNLLSDQRNVTTDRQWSLTNLIWVFFIYFFV